MFCRNCSNQLSDQAVACPKCGMNPRAGQIYCGHCGVQTQPVAVICTACGVPTQAGMAGQSIPGAEKKVVCGVLGIILGALGVHKFVLGYSGAGITMLLVSILTCGIAAPVMGIIGLVEGIIYITKTDQDFVNTYVIGRKEWF